MAKYARDLDENLEKKVKQIANELGFSSCGVTIEAVRLKKSKKSIGEVVPGNELAKLFTGEDNLVVIALYEDAFLLVDDQTQNIWIESLISQIGYDEEKDKVSIIKPELQIGRGMYRKYREIAVQKAELALMTVEQIEAKKAEQKAAQGKRGRKKDEE